MQLLKSAGARDAIVRRPGRSAKPYARSVSRRKKASKSALMSVEFVIEKTYLLDHLKNSTWGFADVRITKGSLGPKRTQFVSCEWDMPTYACVAKGLKYTAQTVSEEDRSRRKPQRRVAGVRCIDKKLSAAVALLTSELPKDLVHGVPRLVEAFGARLTEALNKINLNEIDELPDGSLKELKAYGFCCSADHNLVRAAAKLCTKHQYVLELLDRFRCIPVKFALSLCGVSPSTIMANPWSLVRSTRDHRVAMLQVADQVNDEGPQLKPDDSNRVAAFVEVAVRSLSNHMTRFKGASAVDAEHKSNGEFNATHKGSTWFPRVEIDAELRALVRVLSVSPFAEATHEWLFTPEAGQLVYDDALDRYTLVGIADTETKLARALAERVHPLRPSDEQSVVRLWDELLRPGADAPTLRKALCMLRPSVVWETLFADYTKLDEVQRSSLSLLVTHGTLLLTGAPGTGKSRLLVFLLRFLKNVAREHVHATAVAGKAVQRLRESEGADDLNFRTVSSLLHSPPDACALAIDESSMVEPRHVLKLLPLVRKYLIIAGDDNQLPSIGPGAFLRDVVGARVLPHTRLTRVHRTAPDAVDLATHVPHYISDAPETLVVERAGACQQHLVKDADECHRRAVQAFAIMTERHAERPQMLATTKRSCHRFNDTLQRMLNDSNARDPAKSLVRSAERAVVDPAASQRVRPEIRPPVALGDPVLTQVPIYRKHDTIVNGLMGTVAEVDAARKEFVVKFATAQSHTFPARSSDVELAYCVTAHKFQGSECAAVIVALSDCVALSREMLYTCMSRAQQEAQLFITPDLFRLALRRSERTRRVTKLEARLVVASPAPAVGVPVKRGAEDAEAPPAKKHAAD